MTMGQSDHFMMNQPGFNRGNVLATLFRFIAIVDPGLKRLEDDFRYGKNLLLIHDRFNNIDIPIAEEAKDADMDDPFLWTVDGIHYLPKRDISQEELDDFVEVVNDNYGDYWMISKSPIGYKWMASEKWRNENIKGLAH